MPSETSNSLNSLHQSQAQSGKISSNSVHSNKKSLPQYVYHQKLIRQTSVILASSLDIEVYYFVVHFLIYDFMWIRLDSNGFPITRNTPDVFTSFSIKSRSKVIFASVILIHQDFADFQHDNCN